MVLRIVEKRWQKIVFMRFRPLGAEMINLILMPEFHDGGDTSKR